MWATRPTRCMVNQCYLADIQEGSVAPPKTVLDATISNMLTASATSRNIARRLFLYDHAHVFSTSPDRAFEILNDVCGHFSLPFSAVRFVGSAQLGYSYFKSRDFQIKQSDLDVGIISSVMFQKYSEYVYSLTSGYTDQSKFPLKEGVSTVRAFRDSLSMGFFRPDLMPHSPQRELWFKYFNTLSNKHVDLFKNINAGLYLSECFFEMKNSSVVNEYKKGKK
jgi:hypothetical protein